MNIQFCLGGITHGSQQLIIPLTQTTGLGHHPDSLWGDSGTVSALSPGCRNNPVRYSPPSVSFLGDELGSYYLLIGLGAVPLLPVYRIFPLMDHINVWVTVEKPQYTSFQWGSMMFTAGLAADILFYSLCEWILYAGEDSDQPDGQHPGLVFHLSAVPLGSDPVELLSWYWPLPSASCSMSANVTNRNTLKPAVLSLDAVWMASGEN